MRYFFYDCEVYSNYFLACFKEFGKSEFITFELYNGKNQISELRKFLNSPNNYQVGFNIIHYDNVILNYVLQERIINNLGIKKLSDLIINDRNNKNLPLYKKYKYKTPWISVDIFLLWSRMLRLSKHISLKSLAVAINHPKIQELPYEPSRILSLEEMQQVKIYCYNDVNIVEALCEFKDIKEKLNLRQGLAKKFKDNKILSHDDIKLGLAIIDSKLSSKGLGKVYDYKDKIDLSIFQRKLKISELIFPYIKFQTQEFNEVLNYYNTLEILPKGDKFTYFFKYNKKTYSLGAGGIHSVEEPEIYKEKDDGSSLREKDAASFYPNILIRNKLRLTHLPEAFNSIYEEIYDERIIAKHNGDKLVNETNKLALNGATGMLKNEYSPLCAPEVNLAITINGQLSLLMLIEAAELKGIRVFCCNTDGVIFHVRNDEELKVLNEICSEWEITTTQILEETLYKSYFKRDINNFTALTSEGKIKAKGAFNYKKPVIDSQDFLIIPLALQKYFLEDVPIEKTLYECKDIYKFCASFKVDRKYDVIYNAIKQQQLNRFYPSLKGTYLYKRRKDKARDFENLLADSPVIIFNNFKKQENFEDYNINYKFFIDSIQKIIDLLQPKPKLQLTLEL